MPEQSPCAELSLDEKLTWLEDNIRSLPIDSVICQDKDTSSKLVPIICQDLTSDTVKTHHDKQKLISALEKCVDLHINKSNVLLAES